MEDRKGKIKTDSIFHRAIQKYGFESFVWEILYQSWDEEHTLKEMEPHFIHAHKSHYKLGHGYNMTFGGDGVRGYKPSKKMREKLRMFNSTSLINKASIVEARRVYMKKYPHGPNFGNHTEPKSATKSVVGSRWMFDPTTNKKKRVKEYDTKKYLAIGFILGRKVS